MNADMPECDATRDHTSSAVAGAPQGASPLLEEQVYRTLREALIRGDFPPGEPLSIRRIAAALQISLMPVRTCLRRLAAEQCLDIGPNGTAMVPLLTRAGFAEIVRLRMALEPMAAGLAAAAITTKELDAAEATARHGSERRDGGDEGGYQLANYQFHFSIYRAAHSPLLLGMIETLWVRRSPIMRDSRPHLHARHADLHTELLTALRARDADRAASVLQEDIQRAGDFLSTRLRFADDGERTPGLTILKPLARSAWQRRPKRPQ